MAIRSEAIASRLEVYHCCHSARNAEGGSVNTVAAMMRGEVSQLNLLF